MKKAELALLGVTVFWGGFTFPAMKVSLNYFPPILFLAYRFGLASLLMLLIFGRRALKRETFKEGFILGLTLFFGHGFQIVGLKYTTASNSAFITSLYVVFTPFIAYFMLGGEKVTGRDLTSLVLAVIGLYLISGGAGTSINYGGLPHTALRGELRLPDSPRPQVRREGLFKPDLLAAVLELRLFGALRPGL